MLRKILEIWLPVNQTRPWEGCSETHALLKVIKKQLQHSERFIGPLRAAVVGIIATALTSAVAGAALRPTTRTSTLEQQGAKTQVLPGEPDPHRPSNQRKMGWLRKCSSPTRGQSTKFTITNSP